MLLRECLNFILEAPLTMGYFMSVDSKALFTSTYIDEYQSYINIHVASINSSLGLKVTERSIDR